MDGKLTLWACRYYLYYCLRSFFSFFCFCCSYFVSSFVVRVELFVVVLCNVFGQHFSVFFFSFLRIVGVYFFLGFLLYLWTEVCERFVALSFVFRDCLLYFSIGLVLSFFVY